MKRTKALAGAPSKAGARITQHELNVAAQETSKPAPETPTRKTQPSREGTVLIAVHQAPEVRRQLKLIALEEDRTVTSLLVEGINLIFTRYGKPEIASDKGGKND
jgi:hypothetical protein